MGCSQTIQDGQCCTRISKAGELSLCWTRSWGTACSKEQHCIVCAIHTFPQRSLLNVPQWVCGRLPTRIRMQGQRGAFTLSHSPDPQPGAGRSQPLVAGQGTCTSQCRERCQSWESFPAPAQ